MAEFSAGSDKEENVLPSWLEETPSSPSVISPPVTTRPQELPFHALLWENFEKLCFRLVKLEADVEHCQLYGVRGQGQEGIDLYARKKDSEKYQAYQCKREKDFGPAKIEAAVKKFLAGEWADKAEKLVLCTTESLVSKKRADKLEEQNARLKEKGITLIPWDCNTLSSKLKDLPKLVEDFFGLIWAESFCGQSRSSHPDKEYLEKIRNRYCQWIHTNSAIFNIAGLRLALPIAKAWVELDTIDQNESDNKTDNIPEEKKQIEQYRQWSRKSEGTPSNAVKKAEAVVAGNKRVVITGGPGAGKSTLLKRLAHTFSDEGKLILWVRLPTLVKQMEGKTFEDALIRSSFDGSGISGKDQKSVSVKPDYLFADGLDECDTYRSEITDALVKWGHGHQNTAIIITTRPFGHDAASFSSWKHYSILPLPKKDIAQYAEQIIDEYFQGDRTRTNQELKNFNNRITANKAAGLAARNPLLLGFLIQLSIGNITFGSKRTAMYEQIIRCVLKDPADRSITVEPDEPLFLRVFEIIGWLLQHDFSQSYSDLLSAAGKILKNDLECSLLKAQRSVEQAVKFWTEHRLVEKISIAENEYLVFAHTTFGEFAAAKYALSLQEAEFVAWLEKVRRKNRWRETVLLAAGLKGGERLVQLLTSFDTPEARIALDILLAAAAVLEMEEPARELVEPVIEALLPKLTSNLEDVVLDVEEALFHLVQFAPDVIGSAVQPLLEHPQPWTRVSAWNLALHSGEEYFSLEVLKQDYEDLTSLRRSPGTFIKKATILLLDEPYDQKIIVKVANVLTYLSSGRGVRFLGELLGIIRERNLGKYFCNIKSINKHVRSILERDDRTSSILFDFDRHKNWVSAWREIEITFLRFVVSSLSKKKRVSDKCYEEIKRSFDSLCKISRVMEIGTSPCDAFMDLSDQGYYEEFCVVFSCVISGLQLNPDKIVKEANAAITLLQNEQEVSYFGRLADVDISPDWDKVKLTETEKENIARALDHPSEIVAKTAADIIATGAGGDETAEEVKEILRNGRDSALYFISQIASDVWGEQAPGIILHRLEDELTDGCQHLLEKLPNLSNEQYEDRICATLLKELIHPNVEIALGAAKGYANHHPAQVHLSELKNALSYWKENEEPYPVKGGTVPSSPRETLVQIIDQLNGFTLAELAELCGDPRTDVKDVARDAVLRVCNSDASALNKVIDLIQQEQAPISLLAKLTELPPKVLRNAEKQILTLLDSPVPELHTEILKILPGGWLADETAKELAEKFLDDLDVHVRNQAVASLRELESYEPA